MQSGGHLAFFEAFELQLNREVFRNAKVKRAGIHERGRGQRREVAIAWITQCDFCADQAHRLHNGIIAPQLTDWSIFAPG